MDKKKVLFICVHNSARSQMAEAFLRQLAGDRFEVESAGLEPGKLNPLAVDAMKEAGMDISGNKTKSVFDLYKADKKYDYVITVCDNARESCPLFPGKARYIHWDIEDPSFIGGSLESRLEKFRETRDKIEKHILDFLKEVRD